MDKFIKEFKENEFTYQLGYNLLEDRIYPKIQIYKNNKLLSAGGYWGDETDGSSFYFCASTSSSYSSGFVNTIKDMFNKLRKYSEVLQNIEDEFESLFLLYKLNDFKEFRED